MSVGTFAFAVDLDELRRVFGSKDAGLTSTILSRYKDRIAQYEEHFAEGEPRFRDVLNDIVDGEIRHPDWKVFYVWATELLCHHLGKELEISDVGWLDDLELNTGLEQSGPPLPIPQNNDSPLLGFLTAEQVAALCARLKKQDISHQDEEIEEARRTLFSWVREASESGRALVTLTQG